MPCFSKVLITRTKKYQKLNIISQQFSSSLCFRGTYPCWSNSRNPHEMYGNLPEESQTFVCKNEKKHRLKRERFSCTIYYNTIYEIGLISLSSVWKYRFRLKRIETWFELTTAWSVFVNPIKEYRFSSSSFFPPKRSGHQEGEAIE